MTANLTERRDFLKQAGGIAGVGGDDGGNAGERDGFRRRRDEHVSKTRLCPRKAEEAPKYHIKFAVCGMSHDHIYGMIGAVQRGGGELVAAWGGEEDKLAAVPASAFPT